VSSSEITSPAIIRTKIPTNFDQFLPNNRNPNGDAIDKTMGIMNNRAIDIIGFKSKRCFTAISVPNLIRFLVLRQQCIDGYNSSPLFLRDLSRNPCFHRAWIPDKRLRE
jgi:hypothetical protein